MKKVLIIGKEPELRRTLGAQLRNLDYEPIEAEDGWKGVELAKREKPDLILCEVMMFESDGHGMLLALQQDADLASIPFIFLNPKDGRESPGTNRDLGHGDVQAEPRPNAALLRAVGARLGRSARRATRKFKPDFSSTAPLLKFRLTPRAAETLLWLAQGKANRDIAAILGITESTVKKYVQEIFEKLGVETRSAAAIRALEVLSAPSRREPS